MIKVRGPTSVEVSQKSIEEVSLGVDAGELSGAT